MKWSCDFLRGRKALPQLWQPLQTFPATPTNFRIFTVTVLDKEPPTISCSTNIVVDTDPGECSTSNVTYSTVASDNCPGVTVSFTPPGGSTFSKANESPPQPHSWLS